MIILHQLNNCEGTTFQVCYRCLRSLYATKTTHGYESHVWPTRHGSVAHTFCSTLVSLGIFGIVGIGAGIPVSCLILVILVHCETSHVFAKCVPVTELEFLKWTFYQLSKGPRLSKILSMDHVSPSNRVNRSCVTNNPLDENPMAAVFNQLWLFHPHSAWQIPIDIIWG